MGLLREVCQCCIDRHRADDEGTVAWSGGCVEVSGPWGDLDDTLWFEMSCVRCPSKLQPRSLPMPLSRVLMGPQSWCPYALEHLLGRSSAIG